MGHRDPYDMSSKMRSLEIAHPAPPPEEREAEAERCLLLLTRHRALDVAPLLGLEVPA